MFESESLTKIFCVIIENMIFAIRFLQYFNSINLTEFVIGQSNSYFILISQQVFVIDLHLLIKAFILNGNPLTIIRKLIHKDYGNY